MADYPRIGRYAWRQMMQWGWGIFKLEGQWWAVDASTKAAYKHETHEAATDFVRSEIAKG